MHEKNQVSVFPFCLEADGLPIATRRLPIEQNLDFCLIFRKTRPFGTLHRLSSNISDVRSY